MASGSKCWNLYGIWDLKPKYLGPGTLRVGVPSRHVLYLICWCLYLFVCQVYSRCSLRSIESWVQGFGPTRLGPQAIISWATGGLCEDSVRALIPVNGRHATPRCGCAPTRCPAGLRSHARVLRIV